MGDSKVSAVLHGKDWSHIKPHSHGGSADAANGVFEAASINRARGAEDMGLPDLATAKAQLHAAGIKSAASTIGASALRGAGIAAAVGLVTALLEHGLDYREGRIALETMSKRVLRDAARSAASGAAVSAVLGSAALVLSP